jgi:hypothetical protein
MRRWSPGLGLVSVLVVCLCACPGTGQAQELTPNDLKQIAFAAQRGFEHILQLWKDQRFAELYEFGTFASQVDISPEAFVRYMSYAPRTLQCCWLLLQHVESRVVAPDTVYVRARVGFKNKEFLVLRGQNRFLARGFAEQETLTFVVRWEEARWRIDLFRILDLSGISLEVPGASFYRPY